MLVRGVLGSLRTGHLVSLWLMGTPDGLACSRHGVTVGLDANQDCEDVRHRRHQHVTCGWREADGQIFEGIGHRLVKVAIARPARLLGQDLVLVVTIVVAAGVGIPM
jgi:hypothetical protein